MCSFLTLCGLLWLGACAPAPDATGLPASAKDSGAPLVEPGTLVEIPAGTFEMGCDPAVHAECAGDEAPVHTVELSAFAIEATEVTVGQWRACMAAYACAEPPGGLGADDFPVVAVTADQASAYCGWAQRHLPTEAQWERAARGPEGGAYPWGDAAPDCDHAASRACDGGPVPVATQPFGATSEGVHDMAGNAWEWVHDWYDPFYYTVSPPIDPAGGASGGLRVVRGVDAWSDLTALRATNREVAIPDAVSVVVGFRCAADRLSRPSCGRPAPPRSTRPTRTPPPPRSPPSRRPSNPTRCTSSPPAPRLPATAATP